MDEREPLLRHLREHYTLIFDWHRKQGPRTFRERYQGENRPDDEWLRKYLHLVEMMPHPLEADAEAIAFVAREILCGCMEWSYMEKVIPDLAMCEVAKAIEKMLSEHAHEEDESSQTKKLKTLRNMGVPGSAPSCVEVRVPPHAFEPGNATYLEYAHLAYSDVPTPNDEVNLGGFVALADTNVEVQARYARTTPPADGDQRRMLFRNAKALHMVEDSTGGSLVDLAKSGAISILSVKIGGKDA